VHFDKNEIPKNNGSQKQFTYEYNWFSIGKQFAQEGELPCSILVQPTSQHAKK